MGAEVLDLPWQIQVSLAAGFAGYLTAYVGIRSGHDTTEKLLRTLIFGMVATASYAVSSLHVSEILSGFLAFATTLTIAAFWRKIGSRFWFKILKFLKISYSDDSTNTLMALSYETGNVLTGISVLLEDGTWLCCDDTSVFKESPLPPVTIGHEGDVLFYVSAVKDPSGKRKELTSVLDADFGDRITYVPAPSVKRINLRFAERS